MERLRFATGQVATDSRLPPAALSVLAAAFALLVLAAQGAPTNPSQGAAATAASAAGDYGELPLAFRAGGAPGADFSSATSAGSIALSAEGATIFPSARDAEPVRMSLLGAASIAPIAQEQLPGVVNDLRGDDPSRWRTNVPTYARVRYPDVYPGIALDYHGTTGTLEYDFRLAPGADPQRIGVDFNGAPLRVTRAGALVVGEGAGAIRQAPPVAFQPFADGREPVEASFRLNGDRVGFELGSYDATRPLVIDPLVLSYSTFLGGGDDDDIADIAVDSAGAAYLTGYTTSSNFPTTNGAYDTSRAGTIDAHVTKLNATGTALVYSTLLGGAANDFARGIAVDSLGNAYVTGQTGSLTGADQFPTAGGAHATALDTGQGDVFVTKLNATGSGLVYSARFGGSAQEEPLGIAVDAANHAYIGGYTSNPGANPGFPTSAGVLQTTFGGNRDGFVTRLDASGQRVYSTLLGGTGQDEIQDIDVDSQGRAYVTGFAAAFSNNNFPTSPANRYAAVDPNGTDAFLSRISPSGDALEYSTGIGAQGGGGGNNGADYSYGVAVGPTDGIAYITGGTRTGGTTDFPLKNSYEGRSAACCFGLDLFVSKFDTNQSGNNSLLYSTLISGGGEESGTAIDVDSSGNAYVGGAIGATGSADRYETTPDELGGGTGRGNAIVTKLVQSGSSNATIGFSTTIPNGGFLGDGVSGIVVDPTGNDVYVSGNSTGNAPVVTTAGAFQGTHQGADDGFVSKISVSNDATPPDTAITGGPPAGGTVTSNPFTFTFSATEANSTFECSYDGAAYALCSSPGPGTTGSDTRSLGNGNHSISVRARDAAGNVDASPETRQFSVFIDTTPPETSITSGPSGSVSSSVATFGFGSTEASSTFECSYDGAPFTACTSPGPGTSGSDTRTLANGSHTFAVRARDAAGNVDSSPATRTFTVTVSNPPSPDTSPPETTITEAPPAKVKSRRFPVSVRLAFTSSEPGSTFGCRVDGGSPQGCSSPATLKLGRGEHTISVVATDASANADPTAATATVKVKKKKRRKGQGGGGNGGKGGG